MTTLLERAVAKARTLPEAQQDALASLLLEQMATERLGEDQPWSELSLRAAMRGMEDESGPAYSEADLAERFS